MDTDPMFKADAYLQRKSDQSVWLQLGQHRNEADQPDGYALENIVGEAVRIGNETHYLHATLTMPPAHIREQFNLLRRALTAGATS